jgi:hypothetical protein
LLLGQFIHYLGAETCFHILSEAAAPYIQQAVIAKKKRQRPVRIVKP